MHVSSAQLRAFYWQRQGLDGGLAGQEASAAAVLARTGWSRSVGGCGPYLALFSRSRAGLSREAVDAAVAALQIHELPSARGCTYVVPAADFALALRAGQGRGDAAEIETAKRHCGVTDQELDRLCAKVLDTLSRGPLDPAQIKEVAGDAVRHLGDAGKKRGLTTTLPLALGRLQGLGEIRRVPVNGRLDQQRYRYALWRPSPLSGDHLTDQDRGWPGCARRRQRNATGCADPRQSSAPRWRFRSALRRLSCRRRSRAARPGRVGRRALGGRSAACTSSLSFWRASSRLRT
jgi:hypothetical protein